MNSIEIYKHFTLKINKNDSNEGINILKSHFVLLFNAERLRWSGEKLKKDSDTSNSSDIKILLKSNVELTLDKKYIDSVDFKLPGDLFRYVSSYSIADKTDCKGIKLFNFEKKALGLTATLADDFSKPAFDFEETPVIQTENNLKVFFDGFQVKKVFLTYYKEPTAIDIVGYPHFDGTSSTNKNTELSDESIDEILNRMAVEVTRQFKDSEGVQYNKDRINTES